MQFQYALVALLASTNYVLAVPAADVQDTAELTSVPDGVSVINAAQVADNEVVSEACYRCGRPCVGYYCCSPYPVCRYIKNPFRCVCANR